MKQQKNGKETEKLLLHLQTAELKRETERFKHSSLVWSETVISVNMGETSNQPNGE